VPCEGTAPVSHNYFPLSIERALDSSSPCTPSPPAIPRFASDSVSDVRERNCDFESAGVHCRR
jgi:hypothetical protein